MNIISRLITGSVMIVGGLVLVLLPFFMAKGFFWIWIYGWPILILGIYLFFNKNEDKIEQIKSERRSK